MKFRTRLQRDDDKSKRNFYRRERYSRSLVGWSCGRDDEELVGTRHGDLCVRRRKGMQRNARHHHAHRLRTCRVSPANTNRVHLDARFVKYFPRRDILETPLLRIWNTIWNENW